MARYERFHFFSLCTTACAGIHLFYKCLWAAVCSSVQDTCMHSDNHTQVRAHARVHTHTYTRYYILLHICTYIHIRTPISAHIPTCSFLSTVALSGKASSASPICSLLLKSNLVHILKERCKSRAPAEYQLSQPRVVIEACVCENVFAFVCVCCLCSHMNMCVRVCVCVCVCVSQYQTLCGKSWRVCLRVCVCVRATHAVF